MLFTGPAGRCTVSLMVPFTMRADGAVISGNDYSCEVAYGGKGNRLSPMKRFPTNVYSSSLANSGLGKRLARIRQGTLSMKGTRMGLNAYAPIIV
jgi:hypothetical protein